ncbi:MAG TPA: YidC/Oxa1 family membrane protein insertase [Candidatus Saccharimonadaceae bacterium]|nr:YidC/Oxa1 family membrane protein insertase [Candidatus Saccharimonadaceae bacterium]
MNIFEVLIVQPIFNLLMGLYSIIPGGDFGIALILFTIFVRFAMWPLVVGQLHQVKAMRKLQPELAKIKKASKGNRQLEGTQMLELYKKHGVKPFRSILMLLIQLPIFIALFQVIQIFTTNRDQIAEFTYNFMEGIPAIAAIIANPAAFNENLFGIIDLTSITIQSEGITLFFLVALALVAAYTQYIISKQTTPTTSTKRFRDVMSEAADGKQPDQAELNAVMMSKMVKFLPILILIIMLSLPGALALYYATSNIFAAIQQYFILKRDTTEMDQLADQQIKKEGKKATAKARAKQAQKAEVSPAQKVTRIKAKDTPKKKG